MILIKKNPYQNKSQKRMVTVRIKIDINTIIGLKPFERECSQPIKVILTCRLKHFRPKSTLLKRAHILNYFRHQQPKLLEKAAFDLAHSLHPFLRPSEYMSILIKKPNAIKNAQWAGVQIDVKA